MVVELWFEVEWSLFLIDFVKCCLCCIVGFKWMIEGVIVIFV